MRAGPAAAPLQSECQQEPAGEEEDGDAVRVEEEAVQCRDERVP